MAKKPVSITGRRIQIRRSGVHGKGVFALVDIAEGETLIEYTGEVISWQTAQDRHPHDPEDPNHTFYFHVDDDRVIEALYGGNASRWINHSCAPNCLADEEDGRIFIRALRHIAEGEELHYDYGLVISERYTAKLKAEYPCWCGAPDCRGTLLSPKRRPAAAKLSPKAGQKKGAKKDVLTQPKKAAKAATRAERKASPPKALKKTSEKPLKTPAKKGLSQGKKKGKAEAKVKTKAKVGASSKAASRAT